MGVKLDELSFGFLNDFALSAFDAWVGRTGSTKVRRRRRFRRLVELTIRFVPLTKVMLCYQSIALRRKVDARFEWGFLRTGRPSVCVRRWFSLRRRRVARSSRRAFYPPKFGVPQTARGPAELTPSAQLKLPFENPINH